jgi:hypothetical protein
MAEGGDDWAERMRRWWADWHKLDYSWDGLADKPWEGWRWSPSVERAFAVDDPEAPDDVVPASLQHYWWDQRSALVAAPDGRLYAPPHVPLTWPDGTAAQTDDLRRAVKGLVAARIAASGETRWNTDWFPKIEGADRRAQLQGAVLDFRIDRGLIGDPAGDARIEIAGSNAWLGPLDLSRREGSQITLNATFNGAAFSGAAWFEGAAFSGAAEFYGAAFSGDAGFRGAAFSGGAWFDGAAFSEAAWFRGAWFEGDAYFSGRGPTVTLAPIEQRFTGEPVEDGDGWRGRLTTPGGLAPEAHSSFGAFDAKDAVFVGDVDLTNRQFRKPSRFDGAVFLGAPRFQGSRLHADTTWLKASFDGLEYAAVPEGRTRTGVWMTGQASEAPPAKYRIFKGEGVAWKKHRQSGAKRGWPPTSLVLLDADRRLKGLSPRSELSAREHQKVLDDWRAETDRRRRERAPTRTSGYYSRVEDAFRTLKQAMEDNRSRLSEGRFFRLELKARRLRDDEQVQWWERVFSSLYGLLSDYGNSVIRPVGAFGVGLAGFTAFYWLWGFWLNGGVLTTPGYFTPGLLWVDDTVWDALRYSGSRMFPFGALSDDDWAWRDTLLGERSLSLIVRAVATAQSFYAAVVSFLFALAIRRRFQIT